VTQTHEEAVSRSASVHVSKLVGKFSANNVTPAWASDFWDSKPKAMVLGCFLRSRHPLSDVVPQNTSRQLFYNLYKLQVHHTISRAQQTSP
jgi:hypothetical protein